MLGAALGDLEACLCLHRVLPGAPDPKRAAFNHPPDRLDDLVDLLLSSRPGAKGRWLTLAFDDGYADAADWVARRAPSLPEVNFLFFVCPEKTELRAGFRWDVPQLADTTKDGPLPGTEENARPELLEAATRPQNRLATLAEVRALAQFPNVTLGNHTNLHLPLTRLSHAQAAAELSGSRDAFVRLFGPQTQFAFPFGTPGLSFDKRHVALLRELGTELIWSTEPRPFAVDERVTGALLPRLAVDGRWSLYAQAAWIARCALAFRGRGPRFHCPPLPAKAPAAVPLVTPAAGAAPAASGDVPSSSEPAANAGDAAAS